jgi:hypothetical protein
VGEQTLHHIADVRQQAIASLEMDLGRDSQLGQMKTSSTAASQLAGDRSQQSLRDD